MYNYTNMYKKDVYFCAYLATFGNRVMCSLTATLVFGLSIGAMFFGVSLFFDSQELIRVPSTMLTMLIMSDSIMIACSLFILWKTVRTTHFFRPLGNFIFYIFAFDQNFLSNFIFFFVRTGLRTTLLL